MGAAGAGAGDGSLVGGGAGVDGLGGGPTRAGVAFAGAPAAARLAVASSVPKFFHGRMERFPRVDTVPSSSSS